MFYILLIVAMEITTMRMASLEKEKIKITTREEKNSFQIYSLTTFFKYLACNRPYRE